MENIPKEIKDKLIGFVYVKPSEMKDHLKKNYIVKYVKLQNGNYSITKGGRVGSIIYDKNNKNVVYKLKIINSYGGEWMVKVKDNESPFVFYKTHTVAEKRNEDAKKWKAELTAYEKKKYNEMRKKIDNENDIEKKKQIKKTFNEWYAKRHEDK